MKALLVDDSPAMRTFIRKVLEVSGLDIDTVLEAANGHEALRTLKARHVDLLLCDINMPEMDGEQLLTALKADPESQRPRAVVISTDATTSRVDRVMRLGAHGYLRKPFTPEELREAVGRAMEGSHAGRG